MATEATDTTEASDIPDLTDEEKASLGYLADKLADLGYRAKIDPSTKLIITSTGGLVSSLFYFPKKNIQFRCMVNGAGNDVPLVDVNSFNQQHRFVKLYVDEDQDVMLEADFFFNDEHEHSAQDFEIILTIWESSVSDLKELLKLKAGAVRTPTD